MTRDMPSIEPLDQDDTDPRRLIPAVVAVLPGRVLALHPAEGATPEERRIISKICLAQFLKVLPDALHDLCGPFDETVN